MPNISKKISIVAIVLAISSVFWVAVKPWIESPLRLSHQSVWLTPLILFIVLIAVEGLALTLLQRWQWRLVVVLEIAGAYLAVFGISSMTYLLAVVLMILASWLAMRYITAGSTQRIKVNIFHVMQHGLPWLVTGILILITFAYFLSPKVQATAETQTLAPNTQKFIEQVITVFAGQQTEQLSPQQKKTVLRQATVEVTRQITAIVKPYFRYLPSLLAIGLFIILQGLSFIFVFLAGWLAVLIFKILKLEGFVKIVEKEVKVEMIDFM